MPNEPLFLLSFLAAIVFVVSLLRLAFRSQRARATPWFFGSLLVVIASLVGVALNQRAADAAARDDGFVNSIEKARAQRHGITDAKIWVAKKPALLAEDDRLAKVAAEKARKAKTAADAAAAAKKALTKCLSSWDGSMRALVGAVTDNLRDPSSFEHVETRVGEIDRGGLQNLKMRYRARNGFGGMNVEEASAVVRNEDCALVRWSMR